MATNNTDPTVALSLADAQRGEGYNNLFTDYAILQRIRLAQADGAAAAAAVEALAYGTIAFNSLTYAANVTAGDTTTIGGLVFQYKAAAGSVTNNAYVAVERGTDGTESYANLVAALNASVEGSGHPTIFKLDGTTPALANSTKDLFAVQHVTGANAGSVYVYNADAPGGNVVETAAPSLTFADTFTESIGWRFANLNLSTGSANPPLTKHAHIRHVVTTADITLDNLLVPVAFTPVSVSAEAYTTAGLRLKTPDILVTIPAAIEGQAFVNVRVGAATAGYTPLADTDVLVLDIWGY